MFTRRRTISMASASLLTLMATACGGAPGGETEGVTSTDQALADSLPPTACSGVTVPGDYATVQDAVTALQTTSGGTICLAAAAYAEDISISTSYPLNLQGVTQAQTSLRSVAVTSNSASAAVNLTRLTVTGAVSANGYAYSTGGTISISHAMLKGGVTASGYVGLSHVIIRTTQTAQPALAIVGVVSSYYNTAYTNVSVDSADVQGSSGSPAILTEPVSTYYGAYLTLGVTNSWIHSSSIGVEVAATGSTADYQSTTLTNNTFELNGTAVSDADSTIAYHNNAFWRNSYGVDLVTAVTASNSNNAGGE